MLALRKGLVLQRLASIFARPSAAPSQKKLKVCIFKPDRLGDYVLASGAVRLILEEFGEENCLLVTSPIAFDMAQSQCASVQMQAIPPFGIRLHTQDLLTLFAHRRQLGSFSFDHVVCLRHQRLRVQNLALYWINTRTSHGLTNPPGYSLGDGFEFRFTNEAGYPDRAPKPMCREIEAHRIVVQSLLRREVAMEDVIPRLKGITRREENYLLLNPFSSDKLKDYPLDMFADAALHAQSILGAAIRIVCAPERMGAVGPLEKTLRNGGASVLATVDASFSEYIESIANARGVLTVDTATAHIAAALDIPTVVLLGGGHYGQFGPWRRSSRQQWLSHREPCFGCNWVCKWPEPHCINRIPVAQVADAVVSTVQMGSAQQCIGDRRS